MRTLPALAAVFFCTLATGYAWQRGGTSSAPTNQTPQQAPRPTPPQPTNQPTNTTNRPADSTTINNSPVNAMPIFLTGTVKLLDGSPVPNNVAVRLFCGTGRTGESAYADTKGAFMLMVKPDAGLGGSLIGCVVRASVGGYESSEILLDRRTSLDTPEIGTVYLRPFGDIKKDEEGYTVSLTTKLAPKDARKEYEKGVESQKKEKWGDAEQEFQKAVNLYPNYAVAWFELGRVYQQEKKVDDAIGAQKHALEIEPKFIGPYSELVALSFVHQNWTDVAHYASQVLRLVSFPAPQIYFYQAVANYNLKDLDAAEKSVRAAAALDEKHKVPRINQLLGIILAERGDAKEAAENLRIYLEFNPAAPDAEAVKEQLATLEKRNVN
jgi:Flp pilus assembly protein TadD